ncbi:MAG: hypothetical protein M3416_05410 [Acidobacteriota bacterium]|nr:hypothetical protein [Acidobacteriota bacterium]
MAYKALKRKFLLRGLDLSRPVDALEQGYFPILKNVRSRTDGVIEPRPGFSAVNSVAVAAAIHSVRRLNDDVGPTLSTPLQAYARILGAGTKLYSDNSAHNAFSEIDTGYSGDPLSMIPHRPEQSPQPWMYVYDSARQRKVRVDGTDHAIGIQTPTTPPSVALAGPAFKTIDDFTGGDAVTAPTGWSAGGAAAGALTNPDRLAAVGIAHILYDSGTTGWALVSPDSMADIIAGMLVTMSANTETVPVKSVHKAVTSTTIDTISYDSGANGLCTIKLAAPTAELALNSMLRNSTRSENVRVLSVTYGPDGVPSFRCSTSATFAAGDTIAGLDAFRAHFSNNHTDAETLSTKTLQLIISGSGVTYAERTTSVDLSSVSSRPVLPDDEVVIQLQVSDPSKVTSLQIQLDVDRSANDFTKNYYFAEFRASDLTPAVLQTSTLLTAQQRAAQRRAVEIAARQGRRSYEDIGGGLPVFDPPDIVPEDEPEAGQTATGASQWSTLRVKVKDFERAGSDSSRGWKDVVRVRISANVTAGVTLKADSWHVTGTRGLDSSGGVPYLWRYRYRAKETGAPSPWSPPVREGFDARRDGAVLTPAYSADAQADKIDWIRYGGSLTAWHYVGTSANSGTFADDLPDDAVVRLPLVTEDTRADGRETLTGFDSFVPWPVVDSPKSGTCNVKGTEVAWASGDSFSTAWVRGTQIIINGVPHNLYANPASTTKLSLEKSAGSQTGVSFFLPDPIKEGQPLSAVFGPYGNGFSGSFFFGVREGTLYWANGNNPDSCHKSNQLEITGGSETLMNGGVYDGIPYVLSDRRMYQLGRAGDGFAASEVANSKGLFARWAVCFGPMIWFLGDDGRVYESQGGQPREISGALGPLLPHDGQAGVAVNGIAPPDLAQTSKLRFAYADGSLFFDFQDTSGSLRTLEYVVGAITDQGATEGAWLYHDYTPDALTHYDEEGRGVNSVLVGGSDGKLYQVGGSSDAGTAVACQVRTPSLDAGDPRARKTWGDALLDFDAASQTFTVQPGFDGHATTLPASSPTNAARGQSVIDHNAGEGQLARSASLDITWSSAAAPKLYGWEHSYLAEPEDTFKRATEYGDAGHPGDKRVVAVTIRANTGGAARTVQVQYDGGTVAQTLTVSHNGERSSTFELTPFNAKLLRLLPTDSNSWSLEEPVWHFEKLPEHAAIAPDFDPLGTLDRKRVYGVTVEADTGGVAVNFQVQKDGDPTPLQTVSVNHSGRRPATHELTPFLCHTVRLVPQADVRVYGEPRWHFEPYPEAAAFLLEYSNLGTLGDKFVRAVKVEADTGGLPVTVAVQADGVTVTSLSVNHNGKLTRTYPLTPFAAREVRLNPMSDLMIFGGEWVFDPYPALAQVTTPWTDAGREGPKLLQGIRLKADTGNAEVNIQVQYDGGTVGATVSAAHNGQVTKDYGFTPFVGSTFRLVPQGDIRIWEDLIEWVWEPAPALVTVWEVPESSFGFKSFFHRRDSQVAHVSTADVVLKVYRDGASSPSETYTLPHGSGVYKRSYFPFQAAKSKSVKLRFESAAGFRLFLQDSWMTAAGWGEDYAVVRAFGDMNFTKGAVI